MLDDCVILLTHARHFLGPGCAKLLTGYGACVVCHDEEFFDDNNRAAFEAEFPETGAIAAQEPEEIVAATHRGLGWVDVLISNDAHPAVRAPIRGIANYSMYATGRGAGNALVKSLSLELAAHNIQVNAIAPNYIENPTYFFRVNLLRTKRQWRRLFQISRQDASAGQKKSLS
ncbi:MAG: SDR family NAD(P)-dependent oxidoreductase [Pseudomonadota bacterium]|nr:SDR family NAD(P)-dependent oxidoreductase [Pseudomonadota bacterium]